MAKLPMGMFQISRAVLEEVDPYAAAAVQGSTINQVFGSVSKNLTRSPSHNVPGIQHEPPTSICVEGVFMWLLLIWLTTGTVAMLVLLARCCRRRWKTIGAEEFDWGGLESIRAHNSAVSSGRRTATSVATSSNRQTCGIPPPPPPLPPPMATSTGHRIPGHGHYPCSGLRRTDSSATERRHVPQRKPTRSRRLQSTQA